MADNNDGGPAFPIIDGLGDGFKGLSLRDWFAGQALAAIIQADGAQYIGTLKYQAVNAKFAYEHADAMIAEREKSNG